MHQPPRRIVEEHKQRALRPTILKPPMLATVDLHQFADAVTAATGLVNPFQTLLAIELRLLGRPRRFEIKLQDPRSDRASRAERLDAAQAPASCTATADVSPRRSKSRSTSS